MRAPSAMADDLRFLIKSQREIDVSSVQFCSVDGSQLDDESQSNLDYYIIQSTPFTHFLPLLVAPPFVPGSLRRSSVELDEFPDELL
ncbi:hypothetical protein L6164_007740 [Bauhinia variegata]|uniref:Uncharacterized protein n=1 Tax=Bauhinia variegata TaxID=167791 RepID=A0ACB9PFQ1_BAUVA|nr:hypothetical protein L6164_007740 [Bauhinia variegata]